MNVYDLMSTMGDIDEKYIEESRKDANKKRRGKLLLAVYLSAAVIVAAISIPIIASLSEKYPNGIPVDPVHTENTQTPTASEGTETPSGDQTPTETPFGPATRLTANGLVFELNADLISYSIVDVILKDEQQIAVPESINGMPVTRFKNALALVRRHAGMLYFGDNAVFIGEDAYFIPMKDGVFQIDDVSFSFENGCLIYNPTNTLVKGSENAVLPTDGRVRSIAPCAFYGVSPRQLIIPEGVTNIGEFAFATAKDLYAVRLPKSLTGIGACAFLGCTGLQCVVVSDADDLQNVGFADFFSNPLHCGAQLYIDSTPFDGYAPEPDKKTDPAAWLAWLTEDPLCPGTKYDCIDFVSPYNCLHSKCSSDPSPWDFFMDHFSLLITLNRTDFADPDKDFVWEIFYKKANSSDPCKRILTAPTGTYNWGDGKIMYRLPTYSAGMDDLSSDNGAGQTYRLVIVIHEGGEEGAIVGWFGVDVRVTSSYDHYLHDALSSSTAVL